jgi:hypothetical protein
LFRINYRITEESKEWNRYDVNRLAEIGAIEGMFQIVVNNKQYGHFHDEPLKPFESGFDLLVVWLENLLQVHKCLAENNLCSLRDIEKLNTWVRFQREEEDGLTISVIETDENNEQIVTDYPFCGKAKVEWIENLKYYQFVNELTIVTKRFLDELVALNPLFLSVPRIRSLKTMIDEPVDY